MAKDIRKYIDLIESVFGDVNFSTGDKVNTPMGKGKITRIAKEDEVEGERTLTGHLGSSDKRIAKRAKVDLDDGGSEWFPVFQLSK